MQLTIEEILQEALEQSKTVSQSLTSILQTLKGNRDKNRFFIVKDDFPIPPKQPLQSPPQAKQEPKKEPAMPPKYADGSFRQRGNTLEYRFQHENKQISLCGKTEQSCFDKRTQFIKGAKGQKKSVVYFNDWIDKWFNTYKTNKNKPSTLRSTRQYLEKDIKPYFKNQLITKISALDLQQFLNKYLANNNKCYKLGLILGESLKKAYALQLIKFNPYLAVEPPKRRKESYKALSYKLQTQVFETITEPRYLLMYKIMMCTGLRPAEFYALDFAEDVNYTDHRIHVQHSIDRLTKQLGDTKTKKSNRYIPFAADLAEDLKAYHRLTKNTILKQTEDNKFFRKIFDNLRLDKKYVIYSFRHTFASVAYNIGISEKQIQAWLGHSTLDMTLNVYTELLESGTSFLKEYLLNLAAELKLFT